MKEIVASMTNALSASGNAAAIVGLAVLLLSGFLLTRLTQLLKLPNVTGYIIAGVAIGPYCLGLIPQATAAGMDFVTDIALAFIAFGVGKYLKLAVLKKEGKQVIVITLCEALVAAAAVSLVARFAFKLPGPFRSCWGR